MYLAKLYSVLPVIQSADTELKRFINHDVMTFLYTSEMFSYMHLTLLVIYFLVLQHMEHLFVLNT